MAYEDIGREYPCSIKERPAKYWISLFHLYHEWAWTDREHGYYKQIIQDDPAEDSELIFTIFSLIKYEKRRIFLQRFKKK